MSCGRVAALLHLLCGLNGLEVGAWCWEHAKVIVRHSEAARDACAGQARAAAEREADERQAREDHAFAKVVGDLRAGKPWREIAGKYRKHVDRAEAVVETERAA